MSKRFRNRKAKEHRAFMEAHGFSLVHTHGDDDIYERLGYQYTVKIPNRDSGVVPTGTAPYIVRCIEQYGISRKNVVERWKENGFGD